MRVGECIALDAPVVFAPEDLRRELVDHVGGERARDLAFDLALVAVVDERLGRGDAGSGVRDLVGQHLMLVGPAVERSETANGLADDPVGEIDGVGCSGKIGHRGHGDRDYRPVTHWAISAHR